MKVLEIGCGGQAGPYFDDAVEHVIVDTAETAVANAHQLDPRFTPIVADATQLACFQTASIDIVLARNVFGDPGLGMSTKRFLTAMYRGEEDLIRTIEQRKLAMMTEAARLLVPRGNLVILEHYSPVVAREFITKLVTNELRPPAALSVPVPVPLAQVTAANYARHYANDDTHTWHAVKRD